MSPSRPTGGGYPRGGLHGQIVHAIGRRIVSGQIGPGELLPAEAELPASRTVLREAIKVLAAKGLVESRPKIGTRVRPRSAWNLLDPDVLAWQRDGSSTVGLLNKLVEVRLIVEPAAAKLAARRALPSDIEAIQEAFGQMEAALDGRAEDYAAFTRADMVFHQAIVRACGNDLLEQMSQVVHSALLVSFQATNRVLGNARASLPEHRAVLDAIQGRWAQRAGLAMRRLVQNSARDIARLPGGGP